MSENANSLKADRAADKAAITTDEPYIRVEIDTSGNIRLETVGTIGNQCDLLAGALESRLGGIVLRTNKETYDNA